MNSKFNTLPIVKKKLFSLLAALGLAAWSISLVLGIDWIAQNKSITSVLPKNHRAGRMPLPGDSLLLMEQVYKSTKTVK